MPMLSYRSTNPHDGSAVYAKVFIIRDVDFDLSALPDDFSGSSPHFGLRLVTYDPVANTTHVIARVSGETMPAGDLFAHLF